jgi:hypothetical protein
VASKGNPDALAYTTAAPRLFVCASRYSAVRNRSSDHTARRSNCFNRSLSRSHRQIRFACLIYHKGYPVANPPVKRMPSVVP